MKSAARLTLVAVLLAFAATAFAQDTAAPTKEQKVRRLLVLMKVGDLGVQMANGMIESMKTSSPEVPAEFWDSFMKKVSGDELIDMLIPVYIRNIEEADVDALLTFYSSPAGQRFIAKQPKILEESMSVGQDWGAKLAQKVIEELQQKK